MAVWPDWHDEVEFSAQRPGVTVLHESAELRVLFVALRAGQALPPHRGGAASFHFLEGEGVMTVDGEEVEVTEGATVVAPYEASRGVRATTDLVFLGNLADPAAEERMAET